MCGFDFDVVWFLCLDFYGMLLLFDFTGFYGFMLFDYMYAIWLILWSLFIAVYATQAICADLKPQNLLLGRSSSQNKIIQKLVVLKKLHSKIWEIKCFRIV